MATSKTLTPTNVTIQIPEFTDQPDQRVNSNCIDKEADAINTLNTNLTPSKTTCDTSNYSTANVQSNYVYKCGNMAFISLTLITDTSHKIATSTVIATIPTGYRPKSDIGVSGMLQYNAESWNAFGISLNTSGQIKQPFSSNCTGISFFAAYEI